MALEEYSGMELHEANHILPPVTKPAPSEDRTVLCFQIHGSCETVQFLHQDTAQCHSTAHDSNPILL